MPFKAARAGQIQGGASYLLVDNRQGDVPLVYRASGGTFFIVAPGEVYEGKTLTCGHCNTIVVLQPGRARPRASCGRCNSYVCDRCALRLPSCTYVPELIDLALARPGTPVFERDAAGVPRFDRRLLESRRVY